MNLQSRAAERYDQLYTAIASERGKAQSAPAA